jgi:hypothetical protein
MTDISKERLAELIEIADDNARTLGYMQEASVSHGRAVDIAAALRELQRLREQVRVPREVVVWLIEHTNRGANAPAWLRSIHTNRQHAMDWTTDAYEAIWFCRKHDAEYVLACTLHQHATVTEHMFIDSIAAAQDEGQP